MEQSERRDRRYTLGSLVDTLGELLALSVSPANENDREQVSKLAEEIQRVTGENVEIAYVDQG